MKAIIFDADGMIIHGERFSTRLEREHGISLDKTLPFFKNAFQDCLVGKADLYKELEKVIKDWGWKGSVQDLTEYWFSEKYNQIDPRFEECINTLHSKGVLCFLATNNEKYRTQNIVETRGVGKWFDAVYSSAAVGAKKPESAFFQRIFESNMQLELSDYLFCDDDQENIEGAKKCGLKTFHYTDFETFVNFI